LETEVLIDSISSDVLSFNLHLLLMKSCFQTPDMQQK